MKLKEYVDFIYDMTYDMVVEKAGIDLIEHIEAKISAAQEELRGIYVSPFDRAVLIAKIEAWKEVLGDE